MRSLYSFEMQMHLFEFEVQNDPDIEYIPESYYDIELLEHWDWDAEYITTPLPDEPQQLQFTFE